MVVHPLPNIAVGADAFEVADSDQMRVRDAVNARGHRVVAAYHSHVDAPARPSAADVARWFTPRLAHVIVSIGGDAVDLRAYLIDATAAEPVEELEVLEVADSVPS